MIKAFSPKKLPICYLWMVFIVIARIRTNMRNCLLDFSEKILLRKWSIIEPINDELKNICETEHSRHGSFAKLVTNVLAGLIVSCFFSKNLP
ncbi:transposase [Dyadobacter jejuensis]|uniref:transposase n=1 Tax=Dyadobacter jejuensis TaxID=1082580 RepID=UPI000D6A9399